MMFYSSSFFYFMKMPWLEHEINEKDFVNSRL